MKPRWGLRVVGARIHWFCIVVYMYCVAEVLAATCPITLNGGVCPSAIAENAAPLALPTPCASRGTCVRGACACSPGWAGEDCSKVERRLILGNLAITETAFKEAPERYVDFFTRVFENFRSQNLEIAPFQQTDCLNYVLRTDLVPNWAITFDLVKSSIQIGIISNGFQVAAQFTVSVPNIPVDAYVSKDPGTGTCCSGPNAPLFAETPTCTEACTASLGEKASVAFTASMSAQVFPYINGTTGRLQATVQGVTVGLAPNNLNFQLNCGLTAYPQLLFDLYGSVVQPWGVLLSNTLSAAIIEESERAASELSVETTAAANVTNSTRVEASVVALSFVAGSHMTARVEGLVKRSRFYASQPLCPVVYTTFVDTDSDALLPLPNDFSDFEETSRTGAILLKSFVEARISRSSLRAAMWAALLDDTELMRTLTSYTRRFGLLDARFEGNLDWALPTFEFPYADSVNGSQPVRNTVRFTVQGGESDIICNNTGVSQLSTSFARLSLDFEPFALGNYSSPAATSNPIFELTGRLARYDVSHMNMNLTAPQKLSIPNALLKVLADEWMRSKLPIANDLLVERAIQVPQSLVRFVPGPRLEAVHDYDNEGRDGGNGYLIFTTRCACVAGNQAFVSVQTKNFGTEILPRCLIPCANNGRRLLLPDESEDVKIPAVSLGRRALSTQQALLPFAGSCGPAPMDQEVFRHAVREVLKCAIRASAGSKARYDCMLEGTFDGTNVTASTPRDLCASTSVLQRQYGQCTITMGLAIPALFDDRPCIDGGAFSCSDQMRTIIARNCRCAQVSLDPLLLAECDERFLATFLSIVGVVLPWIATWLIWVIFRMCIWSEDSKLEFKEMLRFRVTRRSRDGFLINVAIASSIIFFLTIVGWVFEDPFKLFARSIVSSDLFKLSENLETTFEPFMAAWSNSVLFFISLSASNLAFFALLSLYLGRCVWLIPLERYLVRGTWIEPSASVIRAGKKLTFFSIWVIRLQIGLVVGTIALPPLFFSFRFSVRLTTVQFPSSYIDPTFDLAANLTSLSTSTEYNEALVDVVGFALMSSAVGFISSGVIYIYHGAVPACFAAAQLMVYLMDRKESRDRAEYDKYRALLPPPDNSSLDRWRRIVFLFVWCAHSAGALGSSIAAILLYQTLRATVGYALCWILAWIVPLPLVAMSTSRKYRKRHGLIAALYILNFAFFTTFMIFFAPVGAAFTNWLAVILIVSIFCSFFLILVSEFLTVADSIESGRLLRERIDAVVQAEAASPAMQKRKTQIVVQDRDAAGTMMAVGNPLFAQEKAILGSGASPGAAKSRNKPEQNPSELSPAERRKMSEHDIMRMMTQPSPTAPIRLKQPEAMAEAAQLLQRRIQLVNTVIPEEDEESDGGREKQMVAKAGRSVPLSDAEFREQERMRRRITRRLAARGVEGDAARELTDRITRFHAMKNSSSAPQPRKPPPSAADNDRLRAAAAKTPSPLTSTSPPGRSQSKTSQISSPLLLSGTTSPQRPQFAKQSSQGSNRVAGAPPGKEEVKPLARAQAAAQTSNRALDDLYAAQFDASRVDLLPNGQDFDDSFTGFVREVTAQLRAKVIIPLLAKLRGATAGLNQARRERAERRRTHAAEGSSSNSLEDSAPRTQQQRRPTNRAAEYHHRRFLAGDGFVLSYSLNRLRSRVARFLNERIRPVFSAVSDIMSERKETDDPATYGLRVPGRRMIFVQGLILMFILLVYVSYNRTSVDKLKDQAIKLALTASPIKVDTSAAYEWPGVQNITEALDVPLARYVARATESYSIMWLIFFLWLTSLIVEIIYATFGRDMEEKRKGIKVARAISFITLPLLLLAVVLPCVPDYVGLSLDGVRNVVPECAPKLTATIIGIASNLFGVLSGVYLAFQTMVVLLLIVPSISRALFFVIAREILDLDKLAVFEPRKQYLITKKRLQNARFVWRTFPFMSPVLTYLPLLLLCQLTGKLYVGLLTTFFMIVPVISAQFTLKSKAEDQKVQDWLLYSTLWIILNVSFTSIIVLVESLDRNQVSFVLQATFQSWTWYVKLTAEVCLAIVVTSDVLYQFMASDDELEADSMINDYFDALEEQAEHLAFMQQYQGGQGGISAAARVEARVPLLPKKGV